MALINVSILLTVKEIARSKIIIDKVNVSSFSNREKKARSGTTLLFDNWNPQNFSPHLPYPVWTSSATVTPPFFLIKSKNVFHYLFQIRDSVWNTSNWWLGRQEHAKNNRFGQPSNLCFWIKFDAYEFVFIFNSNWYVFQIQLGEFCNKCWMMY